jgi:tetratricopeptide (TPR) repeat protein
MKKYLIITIYFISIFSFAQSNLVFNKKFVQSEDKWVAFPADSTGSYNLGFIYIDSQAGLTFDYEGSFKIDEKGKFNFKKREIEGSMKYRLEPNDVLVAFIPENKFAELGIKKVPDWLRFYKSDENTIERQYRWGYRYNGWGECEKALEFLNQAYKQNPKFKGLKVELAYSYNCLEKYSKSIEILTQALKEEAATAYIIKELIYAQAKSGNLQEAESTFSSYLNKIADTTYKSENAFNILQGYFLKKDKANFQRWLTETNLKTDKTFQPYVEQMISTLK